MARPRKPTVIHELSGSFDRHPERREERKREPKLARGLGEPPKWMDDLGRTEWHRVAPDLEAAGVTSRVEATALAGYCQAVSRLIRAEAEIAAAPSLTIETATGRKALPAIAVAHSAMMAIKAYASEFGMTPASRSRVAALPVKAEGENIVEGNFADA